LIPDCACDIIKVNIKLFNNIDEEKYANACNKASPGWCEGVYGSGRKFASELPAESGNGSRSGRNLPPLAEGSDPNPGRTVCLAGCRVVIEKRAGDSQFEWYHGSKPFVSSETEGFFYERGDKRRLASLYCGLVNPLRTSSTLRFSRLVRLAILASCLFPDNFRACTAFTSTKCGVKNVIR
jgi:hypothetical protein